MAKAKVRVELTDKEIMSSPPVERIGDSVTRAPLVRTVRARCSYCGRGYYFGSAIQRANLEGCEGCGQMNSVEELE